jgi:hypothetical protein
LQWRRGFFRVWIVISVLWVDLAVMVAKPDAYSPLWHGAKYVIKTNTGQQFTLDTSTPRDELVQVLDSALRQEAVRPGNNVDSSTRDAILNLIDAGERTRDQALQVWLVTIIPPVALLLLGIALGWVVGGFRKDASRPGSA